MSESWPTADVDTVRRLRVMAAAVSAPLFAEAVLDAPWARAWSVASDLETSLPLLVRPMRSFTVLDRREETLRAEAVSAAGTRAEFAVVLRPGWCLMQSRFVIGGMAAVADGDRTRFAVLGASRVVRGPAARRLLGPLGRRLGLGMLDRLRDRL